MKAIILAAWLVLLLSQLTLAQTESPELEKTIIDGIEREYLLHVPKDLPSDAPLVMVFHGYSGSAAYARSYFNLEKLANEQGFLVVYPQGTIDQQDNRFWQVGYQSHQSLMVNDISFVTQLAEQLKSKFNLSKDHTFIVGFSNGGDLCNKLICEKPELFKAAAPIISCMMKDMYDACANSAAVPVLMLNGTKDDITYWAGDMENKQGYGPYHSTPRMLEFRAKQANTMLSSTETIASPKVEDKTSITLQKYTSPTSDNQVWMYQVNNGGHGHPDYLNLEQEVWDFFSLYLGG